MKRLIQLLALATITTLTGCVSTQTFVETLDPSWTTIKVRAEPPYDTCWDRAVDYLVKRFDLEVLSRTDGYLRTNWCNTWDGKLDVTYRVRVTLKFSPDRKTLEVKTEAEKGGDGQWVLGYDTRLSEVIHADLANLIGESPKAGEGK